MDPVYRFQNDDFRRMGINLSEVLGSEVQLDHLSLFSDGRASFQISAIDGETSFEVAELKGHQLLEKLCEVLGADLSVSKTTLNGKEV